MKPITPAFTVVVNRKRLVNPKDQFGRFKTEDAAWRAIREYVDQLYTGHPRLPEFQHAVEGCRTGAHGNVGALELPGREDSDDSVMISVSYV